MTQRYTDESVGPLGESFIRAVLEGVPFIFKCLEWALIVGALKVSADRTSILALDLLWPAAWLLFCVWASLRVARAFPTKNWVGAFTGNNSFLYGAVSVAIIAAGTIASTALTLMGQVVVASFVP